MRAKTSVGREFQDNTLGRLQDTGQVTTIYLRNRMSLRGRILTFDPYVLILEPLDGEPPQMVYKSSVVSISGPRRPMGRPGGGPPRGPRPGGPPRPYGPRPEGARPNGPRYDEPRPERREGGPEEYRPPRDYPPPAQDPS